MQNIAGHPESTEICTRELTRCRIEVVPESEPIGEPKALVSGRLGSFTFTRAWYYWCVKGNVPLAVAEELYADPVGVTDIRVAGHCGCPPPKDWITFLADDGREVLDREQEASWQELIDRGHTKMQTYKDEYVFADDPAKVGKPYVTSYHIDSELGLRIFADTLKKHGLTGPQHRDRAGGQD